MSCDTRKTVRSCECLSAFKSPELFCCCDWVCCGSFGNGFSLPLGRFCEARWVMGFGPCQALGGCCFLVTRALASASNRRQDVTVMREGETAA